MTFIEPLGHRITQGKNLTTTRHAIASAVSIDNLALWISRGLEFCWLLAVVTVPLAFLGREYVLSEVEIAYVDLPKTALLRTLTGLMACLWLVEWALKGGWPFTALYQRDSLWYRPRSWPVALKGWLQARPTRWVIVAVALYLASTILSTVFSASLDVSLWGLVPGQDTYPAYTVMAYMIIFAVISVHLKTRAQVERLLGAVAVMGVLVSGYAVLQHYGHDIFGLQQPPNGIRATSTMGNPILLAAVMLMSITISLMAATISLTGPWRTGRFWGKTALWTAISTVQILGILYAFARGPWGGAIVSVAVFLLLVIVFVGWRQCVRALVVLGLSAVLTAIIVQGPPRLALGNPDSVGQISAGEGADEGVDRPKVGPIIAFPESASESVVETFTSVPREVGGGGLSSRLQIWRASRRLIEYRPWFAFDQLSVPFLRPLIGYGPDLFKYTYLLERRSPTGGQLLVSERFAHNFFIHNGVELGVLGLLASLGLYLVPLLVGGYLLLWRRGQYSDFQKLAMAGLLAVLVGRFLEQSVGVAAASDLTIAWVVLAMFTALPAITENLPATPTAEPQQRPSPPPPHSRGAPKGGLAYSSTALRLVMAAVLIVGIGALTWSKAINYPLAAVKARDGLEQIRSDNLAKALDSLDRAIELAPDVSVYHNLQAAAYSAYRQNTDFQTEPECGRLSGARAYQVCLARKTYFSNLAGSEQRPLDWRARLKLAESALTLAQLERDPDSASKATRLHHEVAELDLYAWWRWEALAAAYISTGNPREALPALERSLTILGGTPRAADSMLLLGKAHLGMGRLDRAQAAFDDALRLNPTSNVATDVYTNRGAIYNLLGRYQRAIYDLDEAIKINPRFAAAYNNRGNSYGELDQLPRALADFDEAIRLNPQYGDAYYNRALAYTYLGMDTEAKRDIGRATELGIDPVPLKEQIEDAKRAR